MGQALHEHGPRRHLARGDFSGARAVAVEAPDGPGGVRGAGAGVRRGVDGAAADEPDSDGHNADDADRGHGHEVSLPMKRPPTS